MFESKATAPQLDSTDQVIAFDDTHRCSGTAERSRKRSAIGTKPQQGNESEYY
jgi:hypothetical protein